MMKHYWEKDDPKKTEKLIRKVGKEKDQETLARIVGEAPLTAVKEAALKGVSESKHLVTILNSDVPADIKWKALDRFETKEDIIGVLLAEHLKTRSAEQLAFDKIGDEQAIYSYLIPGHPYYAIKAVEFLSDEHLASLIVRERESVVSKARLAAIERISDRDQLIRVASMSIQTTYSGAESRTSGDDRKIIAAALKKLDDINETVKALKKNGDPQLAKMVIERITDAEQLRKIADKAGGYAKTIASEKLEGRKAYEKVLNDDSAGMEAKLRAALGIFKYYKDRGPLEKLQAQAHKRVNGHMLYRTIYREWEQVEYICLSCGKTGGREDDSESTRHYGCLFDSEYCLGFDFSGI